jgi:archaemetzincin
MVPWGVVCIGQAQREVVDRVSALVAERFPGRVGVSVPKELPAPIEAWSPARRQYRAEVVLEQLVPLQAGAERVLGLADLDLFVPNLNFVFGLARPGGPAVVALARLRQEFWGAPADQDLFLARASKEAVHELGHSYGLSHCEEPGCVMRFSNTLRETDQKSDQFGPVHLKQLQEILSSST